MCVFCSLLSIFCICSVSFRLISFLCTKIARKWNTLPNATAFYFVHSNQNTLLSMLCGSRFSIEFLILFTTFWYNVMAQSYPYSIPSEVRVHFCCLFILKTGMKMVIFTLRTNDDKNSQENIINYINKFMLFKFSFALDYVSSILVEYGFKLMLWSNSGKKKSKKDSTFWQQYSVEMRVKCITEQMSYFKWMKAQLHSLLVDSTSNSSDFGRSYLKCNSCWIHR